MVRKSDGDDEEFLVGDNAIDDCDSKEFDEAITSAIADAAEDPANDDRIVRKFRSAADEISVVSATVEPFDDEALAPGFILRDRFEIAELVHSGGMGHVYKAVDNRRRSSASDQIHVAIKMMRRSVASQFDVRIALEREAAKAQRLSHPNIINIYDFDQHDEQFYLVMEWLEGESVNSLLRRTSGQPLAPQFAWHVIEGIVHGLQHAHLNNVVHADINPSNIFITDTQEIKLLDFGVARYDGDPRDAAANGVVWTTQTYASPDVLSGSTPTFEDDVFSVGCVAYRLLTGTHPFAGVSSLAAEKAGVVVPRIPGLSESQWKSVSRALSYKKSDRPNTASAFFAEPPTASDSHLFTRSADREPFPRLPLLPIAAIGVALAGGLWWLAQGGQPGETPSIAEPALIDEQPSAELAATTEASEIDELLTNAARALDEERYVSPENDNARELYRELLQREPSNSIAQGGLRTISDVYVKSANQALQADQPAAVAAALAVAEETDPSNPAVAIVQELLLAQGNGHLANARLAVADGDVDLATELLSKLAVYDFLDAAEVSAVRERITQIDAERRFLDLLAVADAHMEAGRLISPAGDNARDLLIDLQDGRESDARMQASKERLGERLLTLAASASADNRFPEAAGLLDATGSLGVLPVELATVRESLRAAMEETMDAIIQPARLASAESTGELDAARSTAELAWNSSPPVDIPTAYTIADSSTPPPAGGESSAEFQQTNATGGQFSQPASNSNAPDLAAVHNVSLADLAIEKYVEPRYPRSARRRGLTGVVELKFNVNPDGRTGSIEMMSAEPSEMFFDSAEKAVKQWRFAPRDDVVTAYVRLRFE